MIKKGVTLLLSVFVLTVAWGENHYAPGKKNSLRAPSVPLVVLLKRVTDDKVQSILNRFDQDDAGTVLKYMYVDDLEEKVDPTVTMRVLEDIGENLPAATEVNTNMVVERVKAAAELIPRNKLENLLQIERPNVRRFVFSALEGEYCKIPPRVAAVIASHIEHGV